MATADEREMILAACQGGRTNRSGFVRVNCPVCPSRIGKNDKDASLGYRPETGGFRCFKCGVNGRMGGTGYVLPSVADAAHLEEDTPQPVIPLQDFFRIWDDDGWSSYSMSQAVQYMLKRGFSRQDMQRADVHVAVVGKYVGRIIIPHMDGAGRWWGFTSRAYLPEVTQSGAPKVLYPKDMDRTRLYNEQVLWDSSDYPVMVVEGCLDSLWYLPLACASLGKPTNDHLDLLCSAHRPVVFCLDGDAWEAGRAMSQRMRLRGRRADYVRLPAGEDPNSIDPEWLRQEVENKAAQWKEPACTPSNPSP